MEKIVNEIKLDRNRGPYEFINPSESTLLYSSFDSVAQMLANVGKGACIGKMNI